MSFTRHCLKLSLLALALLPLGCGSGSSPAPQASVSAATAGFEFSPAAPVAGQNVQFQDTSAGSPTGWAWAFGDGATSALQNPTHAFAATGTFTVTLTASNAGGSTQATRQITITPALGAPAAAFSFSPASPTAGQSVTFTDASTNTPTSWSWDFGDGFSASTQNPTHTFSTAGTFTVTLRASNASGSGSITHPVTVSPGSPTSAFAGSILLGSPTATSIKVSVLSPTAGGTVYFAYGTTSGTYPLKTNQVGLPAGSPLTVSLAGLTAGTRYYYRLYFQASGASAFAPTDEYTFRTAPPPGTSFTFTIQADSHLDDNSSLAIYQRTLGNVLAEQPDFHVDLGDTFMCEKFSAPFTGTVQPASDQPTVEARYVFERTNFGLISASVPIFLVNGNHEGEAGWLNDGTASNLAVWTTQARQKYYLNPLPDGFYSGDTTFTPFLGQRAAYYAWQWGDALFVVLDPFWNSKNMAGSSGWNITLGDAQFAWLEASLAASTAKYKFVFLHNLVGGLDGQMRGGIEAAPYFESGGEDLDGTDTFAAQRPGWALPIHKLLVKYGVTALFHGHDHLYDHQMLDGVHYQEVPQPSALNSQSGPSLAATYHYASGTILSSSGHLLVTVTPTGVKVDYVRTWLPANETATRKNGQVDDSWTVGTPAPLKVSR